MHGAHGSTPSASRRPADAVRPSSRRRSTKGRPATPSLDSERVRELVASARVATLATLGRGGSPDLVPITYVLDGDAVYSIVDQKPKTTTRLQRLTNIERDSRVTLLIHHYDDDWSALWWCRLRGEAMIGPPTERALELLRAKYGQYREERPDGPMIRVRVTSWAGWTSLG